MRKDHYKGLRYWEVWQGKELVAVTVHKQAEMVAEWIGSLGTAKLQPKK